MPTLFEKLSEETAEITATPPKKAKKGPLPSVVDKVKRVKPGRPAKEVKSTKTKFVDSVIKKAGIKEIPTIESMFRGMDGKPMRIKDIAVFISDTPGAGEKNGTLLTELAAQMPHRNTVNLNAEVTISQTMAVGIELLESGTAYMPICVARLSDGSKQCECWSGRHRLTFLALLYGPEAEVPVIMRTGSTQQIKDAVIYANSSRAVQAMEKVEHSMQKKACGVSFIDARDDIYAKCRKKKEIEEFAVKSSAAGVRGMKLDFALSERFDRKGKVMVGAAQSFFKGAIEWTLGETTRQDVDKQIRNAVGLINAVYEEMKKLPDFEVEQHLSAKTIGAIGKIVPHISMCAIGEEDGLTHFAPEIATKIVSMGEIGSVKKDATYSQLKAHLESVRKKEVKS